MDRCSVLDAFDLLGFAASSPRRCVFLWSPAQGFGRVAVAHPPRACSVVWSFPQAGLCFVPRTTRRSTSTRRRGGLGSVVEAGFFCWLPLVPFAARAAAPRTRLFSLSALAITRCIFDVVVEWTAAHRGRVTPHCVQWRLRACTCTSPPPSSLLTLSGRDGDCAGDCAGDWGWD